MNQQTIIKIFEDRARLAGVSISAVCVKAGVHPTTFFRWKKSAKNPKPIGATLVSIGKIDDALVEMEAAAERSRKHNKASGLTAVSA